MSGVTVLVPNNAAFSAIGSALPDLKSILQYHVVEGVGGYSTALENVASLMTTQGVNVTISIEDNDVFVNSTRAVVSDVLVANGVSSASDVPFTSGVSTPSNTFVHRICTGCHSILNHSGEGTAIPMKTGAVGSATLFGSASLAMNL
ncbi:uncharacterized protein Z518_10656 [Rhinocladiella mackenziei CBS 650.93]|uniref:Rhinocladiella mackenziei CBS 650.93 unplaced genomic scaffold supercont1.9, whole genome shotgun sequence n=1 Tax=Rhinocladiella mackenziei CBS 650.93 TaxID=1442369 RepID=A0A0D2IB66_9EURO|nr:uncharacterized protein Z518_10656 [Rhinocladiella mackenziei CBS 650.93]KIX00516.1 hypothetical protein Z518_10656 [Rhinocladiella mackenziei CBS 650.93]